MVSTVTQKIGPARKLSKNQQAVFDVLRESGGPMSAYQILDAEAVRSKGLKAPLTIYRALEKLTKLGLVHRIESLNAFVACDHEPHAEPPAFMICLDCKRTIEVGTRAVQQTIDRQAAEQGFEVHHMHVEISGRCQACLS